MYIFFKTSMDDQLQEKYILLQNDIKLQVNGDIGVGVKQCRDAYTTQLKQSSLVQDKVSFDHHPHLTHALQTVQVLMFSRMCGQDRATEYCTQTYSSRFRRSVYYKQQQQKKTLVRLAVTAMVFSIFTNASLNPHKISLILSNL